MDRCLFADMSGSAAELIRNLELAKLKLDFKVSKNKNIVYPSMHHCPLTLAASIRSIHRRTEHSIRNTNVTQDIVQCPPLHALPKNLVIWSHVSRFPGKLLEAWTRC